jgi:hypothetical protein
MATAMQPGFAAPRTYCERCLLGCHQLTQRLVFYFNTLQQDAQLVLNMRRWHI